jgi:hypothetical protein
LSNREKNFARGGWIESGGSRTLAVVLAGVPLVGGVPRCGDGCGVRLDNDAEHLGNVNRLKFSAATAHRGITD